MVVKLKLVSITKVMNYSEKFQSRRRENVMKPVPYTFIWPGHLKLKVKKIIIYSGID